MKPEQLIKEIIAHQAEIIGTDLAMQLAVKYSGVQLANGILTLPEKMPKEIVNDLIVGYGQLFGQSSVEVCLEVIRKHPSNEVDVLVPDTYRSRIKSK